MPSDRKSERDARQDVEVAGTFPASDPPSTTPESGARAVPPDELIHAGTHVAVPGAVTLQRRFRDAETAKLALEGLVRDGPVDRDAAEILRQGDGAELRIAAPPADAERLRGLLERA